MFRVPRFPRRRPTVPAALLLAAVLGGAAACSGGDDAGQSTTAPPTTTVAGTGSTAPGTTAGTTATTAAPATTAPAPVSTRCHAGDLRMEVAETGASAGHWHALLLFTNAGATPCSLEGYPGVSFLDASGGQVGRPAERLASPTAPVMLGPGERAHAALNVSNAFNFGEECGQPVPTATVRVFPPDETGDLRAALDTDVCPNLAMVATGPVFPGTEPAADEDLGA
jgi:hypothetical protein